MRAARVVLVTCWSTVIIQVACGGGADGPAEPPPPAVQVSLLLSKARAHVGVEAVTVTWTSQHATSCSASGEWSGARAVQGTADVTPTRVGTTTFTLRCTGAGTPGEASATLAVWEVLPVLGTSYANYKDVGLGTTAPPKNHVGFALRGYGDFLQSGERSLFVAQFTYDKSLPADQATPSTYRFYRPAGSAWTEVPLLAASGVAPCISVRQVLVADFNGDRKPDIFLACEGYDAPPFPPEASQEILSRPDGKYELRNVGPATHWHGAAAADLNRDGTVDLVLENRSRPVLYVNDGTGTFAAATTDPFAPLLVDSEWNIVQVMDVDGDGIQDVVTGFLDTPSVGSAPTPATVLLGTATGFQAPIELPAVTAFPLILDFVVTGTGASRAIYVTRTGTDYRGRAIQRVSWPGRQSTVLLSDPADRPVFWILPGVSNGAKVLLSDDEWDHLTPLAIP